MHDAMENLTQCSSPRTIVRTVQYMRFLFDDRWAHLFLLCKWDTSKTSMQFPVDEEPFLASTGSQ